MRSICRLLLFILIMITVLSPSTVAATFTDELDLDLQSFIRNYEKESYQFKLAVDESEEINDRQIIVKIKQNESINFEKLGVEFVEKILSVDHDDLIVLRVNDGEHYFETLHEINKLKEVLHAEPNVIVESSYEMTDPLVKEQWYLQTVDMFKAWEIEKGSTDITIALIDSGVNGNHPKLKGRILPGYDVINNRIQMTDESGHGTMIASIIAANGNESGMIGLDHRVNILPIKVFQQNNKGKLTDVLKGLNYAINQNVDIINMSYVNEQKSDLERELLNKAYEKGIVLIAASGNNGREYDAYPASYRHVISVGATDRQDKRALFSNYGKSLDLSAPGVDMIGINNNGNYVRGDGTSFAAPIVTAVAALIKAKHPEWGPKEIEWAVQSSARLNSANNLEWEKTVGYGRVNAYRSLTAQLPKERDVGNVSKEAYKLQKNKRVEEKFQLPYDVDWYTFQLNKKEKIQINVTDIPAHIDPVFVLYKVTNKKIDEIIVVDEKDMGENESLIRSLGKGTYYVALFDYYGRWSQEPYRIQYKTVSPPFPDVRQYEGEIQHLVDKEIIRGFLDGTFRPEQPVTRLQAVTMILREMGIDVERQSEKLKNPKFKDLKPGDYGYKEVAKAVELGFIKGKDNHTFDPYSDLTRGQMASILTKAYELKGEYQGQFIDVPRHHWAYQFVSPLAANRITTGYGDRTYRPNEPISREHFTLMLYRMIEYKKEKGM